METVIQLILIASIISLTIILVTVGIWVILILREIKAVVGKITKVGDDIEETARFVKNRVKNSFNMISSLAAFGTLWSEKGKKLAEVFHGLGEKEGKSKKKSKKTKSGSKQKLVHSSKPKRRFFLKKRK